MKKTVVRRTEQISDEVKPPGDLAKEAVRIFERAREMQRQGSWAGYGEKMKRLEQILKRMAK